MPDEGKLYFSESISQETGRGKYEEESKRSISGKKIWYVDRTIAR